VFKQNIKNKNGQSLVGLLLAIAIGAIVLILGAQIIQVSLKAEEATRQKTVSFQLARESFEAAKAIAEEDWRLIYDKTVNQEYYLDNSAGKWVLSADTQYKTIALGQDAYTRWLVFNNVSRDGNGDIELIYNVDNDDPSTRKATAYVEHGGIQKIVWSYYLTRWENEIGGQEDWSGGVGENFSNQYTEESAVSTSTPNEIKLEME